MESLIRGRLRNTNLPRTKALFPVFEAVVNSIHAIDELGAGTSGSINVEVVRDKQQSLGSLQQKGGKKGPMPVGDIIGFNIVDNGVGFHDENHKSFHLLDSEHKTSIGGKGIGRLLFLKAFRVAKITSHYIDAQGNIAVRELEFNENNGAVDIVSSAPIASKARSTTVKLIDFRADYQEHAPKTLQAIGMAILEHVLWYFVREGGAPSIRVQDDSGSVNLDELFEGFMHSNAATHSIMIKGHSFELTHVRLRPSSGKQHYIAFGGQRREVIQEPIAGKIQGLFGKLKDSVGEFIYACYVSSNYLDDRTQPERFGFSIPEKGESLLDSIEISMSDIRGAALREAEKLLEESLLSKVAESSKRLREFVQTQAPRYRPVLGRFEKEKMSIDPDMSDKDLEMHLHKQLYDFEHALLEEGQRLAGYTEAETSEMYQERLASYLAKAQDLKQSDLVNYVFHRRTVLDIFAYAIRKVKDKYLKEKILHNIIVPQYKTSEEIRVDNLWLLDERLSFHDYLASDIPLSNMSVLDTDSDKKPDLFVSNVFDRSILVSENELEAQGSIFVVELKRPMRNDMSEGEDRDPIAQSLGYVDRIRNGGLMTRDGRPINTKSGAPAFCFIVCDLTATMKQRCKMSSLTETSDGRGYFGFNGNFNAYIEVSSYDRVLVAATERNRAFFDRLGLPVSRA